MVNKHNRYSLQQSLKCTSFWQKIYVKNRNPHLEKHLSILSLYCVDTDIWLVFSFYITNKTCDISQRVKIWITYVCYIQYRFKCQKVFQLFFFFLVSKVANVSCWCKIFIHNNMYAIQTCYSLNLKDDKRKKFVWIMRVCQSMSFYHRFVWGAD